MNFNRVMLQHNNELIIIIFCYFLVSVSFSFGQNRVFHNFSRQIALSQYSGRSIQNPPHNQPVLISIVRAAIVVECLNELS